MTLKYQTEIDKLGVKNCPNSIGEVVDNMEAFRFSHNPITHPENFLPNVLIDKIKNAPFNYEKCTPEDRCLRCGASFFSTQDAIFRKWKKLPIQFKENYGYTHIAQGFFVKEDGVMSEIKNEHFTFYQSDSSKLEESFHITSPL